jgi:hypothetical protein
MKLRDPKSIRRAARLAAIIARGWNLTLRFAYRPLTSYMVNDRPELIGDARFIYAFWHEHLFVPVYVFARSDTAVLASQHADGELVAQVAERFGFRVVRGSTTRGGTTALLQMLRKGWGARHLAITPDGPRGPRRKCQFGAVYLASRTGLPIVCGGFGFSHYWRAGSWDRFAVPMPFSRVRCVTTHAIHVPPGLNAAELEPYQRAVEESTNHAAAIAEHWAETGEFDPLGYRPPPDAEVVPEHQKAWLAPRRK